MPPATPGEGVTRRCHLSGEMRTSRVWFTRTLHAEEQSRRVYASPEAYWRLDEADRATYRRQTVAAAPTDPEQAEHGTQPQHGRARQTATRAEAARSIQPADAVIQVEGLEKRYPDGTEAVKGIHFSVRRGEIFGVLGPNGAGKTTMIGMLGTLVIPTGGSATVAGIDVQTDPEALKPKLGFAMQEVGVDELATGREFLLLQARLYGLDKRTASERAEELLALFELEEAADKRIGGYSGGMKRRIDLAGALIHEPEIIFLDEPTEGLDPRARREMWELVHRLNRELDATILLSTHYMEEADALCDRLAIMDQGEIVVQGSPEELKAAVGEQSIVLAYDHVGDGSRIRAAEQILVDQALVSSVRASGSQLYAYVSDPARSTPAILRALEVEGLAPESLEIHRATLDDVYLAYTGRSLEQAEAAQADEVEA